jgi:hypothetical protein
MKLQFSARQALTPEQIANWQHVPLNVSVETLQIEAIARHEWHGLAWIQRVDQEVIPTGLLQSCEWHKREEQEVLIPNTKEGSMRFICRWLVMEITE